MNVNKQTIRHWNRWLERSSIESISLYRKFRGRIGGIYRRLLSIMWYAMHPGSERFTYYDHPQPHQLLLSLNAAGLTIIEQDAEIYLPGFYKYLERNHSIYARAGYFRLFNEKGYFFEKALEHYISFELLEVSPRDRLLDIGCWGSPAAEIAERERSCEAFKQDLVFEPGVNGKCIGSDVRSIPMPDEYFTKITAHCAIDNFEGDADVAFVREAQRLLRRGGKAVVIPLHLATRFENVIDPFQKNIETDPEAVKVFKPFLGFRFGRLYDVDNLKKKILKVIPGFDAKIYYFKKGFKNIHEVCHLTFALVLTKIKINRKLHFKDNW